MIEVKTEFHDGHALVVPILDAAERIHAGIRTVVGAK